MESDTWCQLLHNDTYRGHAVDLIPSQLQQLLVSTFSHQLECGLLEARLALEQQACYVSDALERERDERMNVWMNE